jgi:choline dehydrogenase-like flavoprotein
MSDADFIVVGSGPAGVSAALALTDAGRTVLMLDGGTDDNTASPASDLGDDNGLSPKLRTPQARRLLARFAEANAITGENFLATGSLARGGLSRIWGGFAAEFDANDLKDWPIDAAALAPSYARISARIGISGSSDDAMSTVLGSNGPLQPPLPLGAASALLLQRHEQSGKSGALRLGHARNALLSRPLDERGACDLRGACLWGCPIGAIYDARQDLNRLRARDTFRLADGAIVTTLTREEGGWRVDTQDGHSFRAPRIVLAAGALASTRLVAPLLAPIPDWPLLSNPTLATPLLVRGARTAARVPSHALAQLAYCLEGEVLMGAVYETRDLPASGFTGQMPLPRGIAEALFRFLSPALLVTVTSFPGRFSRNRLSFDHPTGRLTVQGGFEPALDGVEQAARKALARGWRALGAHVLPGERRAMPGTDAHFAGTLPMGGTNANGTSVLGEIAGRPGLHVVDGSVLPSLPAKHATLTIMANADRIAAALARERA